MSDAVAHADAHGHAPRRAPSGAAASVRDDGAAEGSRRPRHVDLSAHRNPVFRWAVHGLHALPDVVPRRVRGRELLDHALLGRAQHGRPHRQLADHGAGVRAAQTNKRKATVGWLILTMLLGLGLSRRQGHRVRRQVRAPSRARARFRLGRAGPRGGAHSGEPRRVLAATSRNFQQHTQIFFSLYFTMTGLHALHMIIGIALMMVITWMAWQGQVRRALLHAGRDERPLLALRRHRLDLSVPAPLPHRSVLILPCRTVSSVKSTSASSSR